MRRRQQFSTPGCLLGGLFCGFFTMVFLQPTDFISFFKTIFSGLIATIIGGIVFGKLMK